MDYVSSDAEPTTELRELRDLDGGFPHLMVDTETMGRCSGAVPLAIGAVPFSVEDEIVGPATRVHVSFEDALRHGLGIEAGTTHFWMENSEGWLRMQEGTVKLAIALHMLKVVYGNLCKSGAKVWARGTDFDFGLVLRPAYDAVGGDLPWSYSDQRDHRTLGFDRPQHDNVHDPVADAAEQARQIVNAPQALPEQVLS